MEFDSEDAETSARESRRQTLPNNVLRRRLVVLKFVILIIITSVFLATAVYLLVSQTDIATSTLLLMNAVQVWLPGALKDAKKALPRRSKSGYSDMSGSV